MAAPPQHYRFGAFALDALARRLTREGEPVFVPDRQMDALILLVRHAGHFVPKHTISEQAWRGVAVTDNAVVQAIKGLREKLGQRDGDTVFIEAKPRAGYRFVMPVETDGLQQTPRDIGALVEGDVDVLRGKLALEEMTLSEVEQSHGVFARVLERDAGHLSAKIGMAAAAYLLAEASRVDRTRAPVSLIEAERHVREACALDPRSADAWSTLALLQHRAGQRLEAMAAARKAVALEPDAWLHHVRLAAVSWGDERLRAANRALALNDQHALGHWFVATVFVARQGFGRALEALAAGCAVQDAAQADTGGRFRAVGLHWLRGLVLAALHRQDEALVALERERAFEGGGHVYAREACANSWYATAALHWKAGRPDLARDAWNETLIRVPMHPCARAARAVLEGSGTKPTPGDLGSAPAADDILAHAVTLCLCGQAEAASRVCQVSLQHAVPGSTGWVLPVEPVLRPTDAPALWAPTLALVRARAL